LSKKASPGVGTTVGSSMSNTGDGGGWAIVGAPPTPGEEPKGVGGVVLSDPPCKLLE